MGHGPARGPVRGGPRSSPEGRAAVICRDRRPARPRDPAFQPWSGTRIPVRRHDPDNQRLRLTRSSGSHGSIGDRRAIFTVLTPTAPDPSGLGSPSANQLQLAGVREACVQYPVASTRGTRQADRQAHLAIHSTPLISWKPWPGSFRSRRVAPSHGEWLSWCKDTFPEIPGRPPFNTGVQRPSTPTTSSNALRHPSP